MFVTSSIKSRLKNAKILYVWNKSIKHYCDVAKIPEVDVVFSNGYFITRNVIL